MTKCNNTWQFAVPSLKMDEPLYQKYLNKLEFTGVSRFRIWTTEYDENDTSSHDWISEDRFPYFIPHIVCRRLLQVDYVG